MASSWTDFLCCPRKDRHPEAEAYDGPGGTQPVACTPSVTDSSEENTVLQRTTSDLHGTKPGAGLAAASVDPEQAELSAQIQATNALSPELELLYEKRIQDLEDELNLVLRRNKELSARICELEDLMFPEIERTSWAENQPSDRLKEQLGKSLKDKRGQERRALKAEENLRDLKHQNAVLQKRLYQAGSLSPGHVSMPPVPPSLSSSAIGPMFSVLRNTTIKLGPVIPQESAEVSGLVQENAGESGSPSSMNDVLEKIRSGVALRPVTPPMKSTVALVTGIKPKSPPAGSGPQFEGTLPKQQVESTDIMLDGPSTSAVSMAQACSSPTRTTEMRKSPGNGHNPCTLEEMENPGSASDSGEAPGSTGSTDDEGSTSSTLPVASDHSAEDDRDTDPDAELEHGSDTHSWVGCHRQKRDEPIVHLEAPVEPVASDTETSVDISYLEVEKSTVALSEQISDKAGNEGHAETILSFCPTKCINGFSFHVSSGKELDQHSSSSSGGRDGANPSSHVNIADTLATLIYQSSDGVTCVPSENSLSARHDSTQANILEVEDDLPVDVIHGKDGVCTSKDTEMACSIISVQSHGEPTDTTSSPKLEDLSLAQKLEMVPLIGSVQEDELSRVSGKPVAVSPHKVQQFLVDVSSENCLAVTGLKSQKEEDCTSTESIFEPSADMDVATSTDSGFF